MSISGPIELHTLTGPAMESEFDRPMMPEKEAAREPIELSAERMAQEDKTN